MSASSSSVVSSSAISDSNKRIKLDSTVTHLFDDLELQEFVDNQIDTSPLNNMMEKLADTDEKKYKIIASTLNNAMCCICQSYTSKIFHPVTHNDHHVCYRCRGKIQRIESDGEYYYKCPICRALFNEWVSTPSINLANRRMFNITIGVCPEAKCDFTGTFPQVFRHWKTECKCRTIKCPGCHKNIIADECRANHQLVTCECQQKYYNCIKEDHKNICELTRYDCEHPECGAHAMTRESYNKHKGKCNYRITRCSLCGLTPIVFLNLKNHEEKECPNRTIICELCSENLIAKDLKTHLDTTCEKTIISCKHGCDEKFERELEQKHDSICLKKIVSCKYLGCTHTDARERMLVHEGKSNYLMHIGSTINYLRQRNDSKEINKICLDMLIEFNSLCANSPSNEELIAKTMSFVDRLGSEYSQIKPVDVIARINSIEMHGVNGEQKDDIELKEAKIVNYARVPPAILERMAMRQEHKHIIASGSASSGASSSSSSSMLSGNFQRLERKYQTIETVIDDIPYKCLFELGNAVMMNRCTGVKKIIGRNIENPLVTGEFEIKNLENRTIDAFSVHDNAWLMCDIIGCQHDESSGMDLLTVRSMTSGFELVVPVFSVLLSKFCTQSNV